MSRDGSAPPTEVWRQLAVQRGPVALTSPGMRHSSSVAADGGCLLGSQPRRHWFSGSDPAARRLHNRPIRHVETARTSSGVSTTGSLLFCLGSPTPSKASPTQGSIEAGDLRRPSAICPKEPLDNPEVGFCITPQKDAATAMHIYFTSSFLVLP